MIRLVGTRLLGALVTLFVGSIVVFMLVRIIPGNPVAARLGLDYSPEVAASLNRLYGLDKPLAVQYKDWVSALVDGDFGYSFTTRTAVLPQVAERAPRTIYLMVGGIIVGLLIAVPSGIIGATRRGRLPDLMVSSATTILMSVPAFWLGILLVVVFSVKLHWLPAAGWVDPMKSPLGSLESMVLPWLTLGFTMSAFIARVLRSSLLDVLNQDYIRTARARGLSERLVILQHALKNAALPAITVVGLEIGYLMGGAIVVEKVFAYPGMGQLIVNSISGRDYPMIQISILFFMVGFIVVNLVTDLLYAAIDPRIRARHT